MAVVSVDPAVVDHRIAVVLGADDKPISVIINPKK